MKQILNSLQDFLKLEQAGGLALIFSVLMALIFVNSPLSGIYQLLHHSTFSFELLGVSIVDKTFHYFVNDGLMAIFFLLIGLEVKREFLKGELSDPKKIILPAVAAVGGLIAPILIYFYLNNGTETQSGWAIPAATDIAIAFGVLALIGNRISNSLKVFLMMLAIFDDLLVIGIIGVFFTENLNFEFLGLAALCCSVLAFMNYKNIENFAPFAIVGFILWYFILQSGIHATVAGILLAIFIPMQPRTTIDSHSGITISKPSMLESLEHSLHEFVSFGVLPIFAFMNAGVLLTTEGFLALNSNLSLGIILGLFLGKQLGVFGVALILIKTKIVTLPQGSNLMQLYGVSILCGIGFTMGLFIGDLAFTNPDIAFKLPVLIGSLISALVGLLVLHLSSPKKLT